MTRTITTAAELDALPARSIVRLATGHAAYRGTGSWVSTDGDGPPIEYDIDRILPATVLHDPSAPAPAPSVVPEAAVEGLDYTDIANRAQAATGRSIWPRTAEAVLIAALPLLTAAPSATRDEVAAAVDDALNDAIYEDGTIVHDAEEGIADALLARFTITPKEDR